MQVLKIIPSMGNGMDQIQVLGVPSLYAGYSMKQKYWTWLRKQHLVRQWWVIFIFNVAFLVRGNNKPKIGDIIFINWSQGSSPDHVGIIAKTDDTYTYTIEGNRSNSVASARYKYSDKRVIGYGLPNFIDSEDATDTPAIVDEEYEIGTYTVISKTWLNVRTGPGYTYDRKEFKNLSSKVQKAILKAKRIRLNGLVKDMSVEVTQIKNSIWGKISDGWICLDFCKKELS